MARLTRRDVLKGGSAALALGVLPSSLPAEGGPRPSLNRLLKRSEPEIYAGDELRFIGMPVGGLFAGTVYLGGDGQLWNWDIFNQGHFGCVERSSTVFMGDTLDAGSGANYVDPVREQSPFKQRWRLLAGERDVRFGDIRFRGEYPVGRVWYSEADSDVELELEAFSPFIPLEVNESAFPATTLTFKVKNVGKVPATYRLEYVSENPVLRYSANKRVDFGFSSAGSERQGISWEALPIPPPISSQPDQVFETWSSGSYGAWKTTGTAFGKAPRKVSELPAYMGDVHAGGAYVANSHETRNGEDVAGGDAHTGTLTSPNFTITLRFINLRVGGGNHPGGTCVNLVVDGKVVRSVTGRNSNAMAWQTMDVEAFEGKEAHLVVVDDVSGPWGNISLGEVVFSERPIDWVSVEDLPDFGSFAATFVEGNTRAEADDKHGTIAKELHLAPGETAETTLIVAWHFPNCARALPGKQNWYASRWQNAAIVVEDLSNRWTDLREKTLAWNRTWYDSTLPHWFLDRTFANTSTLATTTCHRLDDGRFYFWEGVGAGPGTCTHVYGYAQAVGRVFPEVERYLRKAIDFGLGYHAESGAIGYRGEYGRAVAVDGQTSCILRAYREHQMAPSNAFLNSIWPQVQGAMRLMMRQDPNHQGVLSGPQYNTLDTAWYGEIAWISSLYVAALRACEAMAKVMGDNAFAAECGALAEKGTAKLVSDLFNGEFFTNRLDPAHPEANNTNIGCHIDQVYGQSWAHQVGLPRVIPEKESKQALKALFKYGFYDDVWEYRRKNRAIPTGRWYATPKESGLIMCTFPQGGADRAAGKSGDAWAVGYFNECMTGFEYQVANHMLAEGLLTEGLTIIYAIHARYHPSKRNPYNEIEYSDHYGRAMASYGAFVSLCGFLNDGPNHKMSFSPKVPGRFRCAFINEKGWGTFERGVDGKEAVTYTHLI